jgi:hypothetical protein
VDPKATSPNSQSPNFLLAVRSTFRKSGLQPFKAMGAGHGDTCGLPVMDMLRFASVSSESSRGGPIVMEKDGKRVYVRPDGSYAEVK